VRQKWSPTRIAWFTATAAISLSFLVAGWTSGLLKPASVKETEFLEALARDHGITDYFIGDSGFFRDKIELTPLYGMVIHDVELLAEKEMENSPPGMGRIHAYEEIKKRLLKEKYGVVWRTTQEMNPHICID
jgi:hypothetical protein